jgi:AraC-like DNA-binding protein
MPYYSYIPGPPLSAFVDSLWYSEGRDAPRRRERVLPSGTIQLIINLSEDRLRQYDRRDQDRSESFGGGLVCGARSEFVVIESPDRMTLIGAAFKPVAGSAFLGMPASELHNASTPLDALWGFRASSLRDRLLESETVGARFQVLEAALTALILRRPPGHPAVEFALKMLQRSSHTGTIGGVTDQVGLSPKRFIQVFSEQVGLTPKLFARVRRFQNVLGTIGGPKQIDWTAVALDCGYFDQAHFIHDFRAFAGLSPTRYLAQRSEHQNHVALID